MNQYQQLAKWSRITGWAIFLSGIVSALSGLFAFIIGAIPGILSTIMGWKLIQASKCADFLTNEPENAQAQTDMLSHYIFYFKFQGILILVGLVFVTIGLMIGVSFAGGVLGGLFR